MTITRLAGMVRRALPIAIVVLAAIVASLPGVPSSARAAAAVPESLEDAELWRLVTELSEEGGTFAPELMSNEDSAQFVIPALTTIAPAGGVYVGVGPEQNFTYIAALRPRLAFIVDIRRDNMLQHLMYKALFELSQDRIEFLARLFSRPRPAGLDARSSAAALFASMEGSAADPQLCDRTLSEIGELLERRRRFTLSDADRAAIARMLQAFMKAGPHALKGFGDKNLTYVQAMTAADLTGAQQSYLASEERFRIVKELHRRNLIVPIVGDFAGDTALVRIGAYLREHDAAVRVFYVSNVERYLFERGDRSRRFYANVAALPLEPSATFIRSVTRDIGKRLGFPLPERDSNWWSTLAPIRDTLEAAAAGRLDAYPKLFGPVPN
jgi:hypothetical protein